MNSEILGEILINTESLMFLAFRFMLNLISISILVYGVYYKLNKNAGYLFVLYIFNILVFFVSSVLGMVQFNSGFAFGLFAVFSIIRYRTRQVPIREMTFLFISIILAIINSAVTGSVSLAELAFANFVILIFCTFTTKVWANAYLSTQTISYDKINLVVPDKREKLIDDLKKRTGLAVVSVKIDKINFLKNTATITVFYKDS